MTRTLAALSVVLLSLTPALAAVDRETAVTTLAGFYNSADICRLIISRAKVDAYADANRPEGDTMFNVDVFRATQSLYTQQKDWSDDQTKAYCSKQAEVVRSMDMGL